MNWINTKDQKPTDDQSVLVYQKSREAALPVICWYDEQLDKFIPMFCWQEIHIDADYWMPLPDCPKE